VQISRDTVTLTESDLKKAFKSFICKNPQLQKLINLNEVNSLQA
jgi:hypothetical protein